MTDRTAGGQAALGSPARWPQPPSAAAPPRGAAFVRTAFPFLIMKIPFCPYSRGAGRQGLSPVSAEWDVVVGRGLEKATFDLSIKFLHIVW